MIPSRMLPHTVTISRLKQDQGVVRRRSVVAEDVQALVLPAAPDVTSEYDITVGQGFKIFFNPEVSIDVTDKIVDNRGRVFIVQGISEYEDFGRISYIGTMCKMVGKE